MSSLINIKDGASLKQYSGALHHILSCLYLFSRTRDDICPKELVITSINDSTHKEDSKHYKNEAVDLRSKNFDPWKKSLFVIEFMKLLNATGGTQYVVLLENLGTPNEHFHIQVKKGTDFNG